MRARSRRTGAATSARAWSSMASLRKIQRRPESAASRRGPPKGGAVGALRKRGLACRAGTGSRVVRATVKLVEFQRDSIDMEDFRKNPQTAPGSPTAPLRRDGSSVKSGRFPRLTAGRLSPLLTRSSASSKVALAYIDGPAESGRPLNRAARRLARGSSPSLGEQVGTVSLLR